MDELEDIVLSIENGILRTVDIQKLLLTAQRAQNNTIEQQKWKNICSIIWTQVQQEHDNFDDQLLLCTCFYTVLLLTDNKDNYLRKILHTIEDSEKSHSDGNTPCVCLVYGMFQSSFIPRCDYTCSALLGEVLLHIFQLFMPMANAYSRYTYIVFKVLSLFKKVINTEFETFIYSTNNKIKLLNLVNHNWENPITGIRDLNRIIFKTLISLLNNEEVEGIIEEIHGFNWNKAKYLMLSEIIEHKSNVELYLKHQDWIDGVFYSMRKPGLVSAGADMYFSILKSLHSDEQWCSLFLHKIKKILAEGSKKTVLNFCNYWCVTTFKIFPSLINILLHNILEEPKSVITNYSIVCIWKQANKLGYLEKAWDDKCFSKVIQGALENSDIQMRIFAFDILCVSKLNTMPSKTEYRLMIIFITDNINSDSTVLRLNMLSSLKFFLIRIHTAFACLYKNRKETAINDELAEFCTKIQELLVKSLTMQGNYQRKITSLKLCDVFFKYFTEVPRKNQQYKTAYSLLDALEASGVWTLSQENFVFKLMSLLIDPAEDIRENAMQLLLNYYFEYLKKDEIHQSITVKALDKIKCKFFYEINCGHTFFKLLLNIVIKEEQTGVMFKSVNDIFEYAYQELVSELSLKRDIVQSIEAGKQLHSFMTILSAVLGSCLGQQTRLSSLDHSRMLEILKHLEDISNQFVSEDSLNADFSKISNMVEDTITKSGLSTDDCDAIKISGIHQIVLNCMWLNVKETCVLACLFIKYDEHPDVSLRCLNIITHALETSRHKGAMEAAGLALGQGIQYLTSLPKGSERSQLPQALLKIKLNKLISDAVDTAASVTRRGAGLSILVHRIVSSDAQKGKPLFHYFMKTLLASCSSIDDVPSDLSDNPDVDNEKDLPKAVYIHFLTRIIIDSSLASDIMFYSASLAELAFNNLTSKHWQIRNAALQLYGALIPKLIGQNKQSGEEDETIATVACDEFRTHSPRLWQRVLNSFHQIHPSIYSNSGSMVLAHADLVPAVNLLASCAKRYNFRSDKQMTNETTLFADLLNLLSSPLHIVRRLAAKCVYNMFPFEDVYKYLMSQSVDISENALHGALMLTQLYHKHLASNSTQQFTNLAQLFTKMFNHKKRSYASRLIFDDMFLCGDIRMLEKYFIELGCNAHEPGIGNWIKIQISRNLRNSSSEELPLIINLIAKQRNFEEYCELLLQELDSQNKTHLESLGHLANCLLGNEKQFSCEVVWKILYGSSLHIKITNISGVVKYFETNETNFRTRYILPLLARTINSDNESISKLSNLVFLYSDSEKVDCDMRYVAALSNNEFGKRFGELNDSVKINAVKTAVALLQDEDEGVRYLSAEFYANATRTESTLQPYVCLHRIVNLDFLMSILSNSDSISKLCNDLLELHTSYKSRMADEYNPFCNETNNIYKENEFTTSLIKSVQDKIQYYP